MVGVVSYLVGLIPAKEGLYLFIEHTNLVARAPS